MDDEDVYIYTNIYVLRLSQKDKRVIRRINIVAKTKYTYDYLSETKY